MSKAFLIVGLTGSGKTTYSQYLSKQESALHLCLDEWMKTLFWMDAAEQEQNVRWAMERVHRVEAMMESIALQESKIGHSLVFDLGFSKKEQRLRWRDWLDLHQIPYEIIFLKVPKASRWARIDEKNQTASDSNPPLDRRTFEYMDSFFDELSEDELKFSKIIESD